MIHPQARGETAYRLGTTSFILPDAIVPNLDFLSGRVCDVELLFFESGKTSWPTPAEIAEIKAHRENNNISLTAHLPVDLALFSPEPNAREDARKQLAAIVNHVKAVEPVAWILHLTEADETTGVKPGLCAELVMPLIYDLNNIIPKENLCIENLPGDDPVEISNLAAGLGTGFCLDVGHMLKDKRDLTSIEHMIREAKVIHLHGVDNNKDHKGLQYVDKSLLKKIHQTLDKTSSNQGLKVLTIEVFNEKDLTSSLDIWKEITGQ